MFNGNKVCFIGNSGVGKSALNARIMRDIFDERCESTIGAAYFTKTFKTKQNAEIKIGFWDTAGQERYSSLVPMYLRNAKVILCCFHEPKLEQVESIIRKYKLFEIDNIHIILIATKMDVAKLYDNPNMYDNIQKYADEMNIPLIHTSAKTGAGINKMLELIVEFCYDPADMSVYAEKNESKTDDNSCCFSF